MLSVCLVCFRACARARVALRVLALVWSCVRPCGCWRLVRGVCVCLCVCVCVSVCVCVCVCVCRRVCGWCVAALSVFLCLCGRVSVSLCVGCFHGRLRDGRGTGGVNWRPPRPTKLATTTNTTQATNTPRQPITTTSKTLHTTSPQPLSGQHTVTACLSHRPFFYPFFRDCPSPRHRITRRHNHV